MLTLIMSGCSESSKIDMTGKFTGRLSLNIELNVDVKEMTSYTRAQEPLYQVRIFRKNEAEAVASWDDVSVVPSPVLLPEGDYTAEATSGTNPAAAFDSPYYYGKTAFKIISGETVTATLTCTPANVKITVEYSTKVLEKFDNYSVTVSNEGGSLTFGKTESRAGYFQDNGKLQIDSHLEYSLAGTTFHKDLTKKQDVVVGKHYKISVDATPDNGSSEMSIALSEQYEEVSVALSDADAVIPPGTGEWLITEIMANPKDENTGEWLEVKNMTATAQNLNGIVLQDGSASFHKIAADVIVAPGGYAVIARNSVTPNVDYITSYVALSNTGETLSLRYYGTNGKDGALICMVDFRPANGFPSTNTTASDGKAIQLNSAVSSETAARNGANWSYATQPFTSGANTEYGTPGAAND